MQRQKDATSNVQSNPSAASTDTGDLPAHHVANPTFTGPRFQNPWPSWESKTFLQAISWQRGRSKLKHSLDGWLEGKPFPTPQDFAEAFPLTTPDWAALAQPASNALQALWVGHATVLVQQGGFCFMTDPCLSDRCSPVQWAGPKRLVPPALSVEDPRLPSLDFILLSHNHYDHLDSGTVHRLFRKFGSALKWYVPLGLKKWFDAEGIHNVEELDWWQETVHVSRTSGAEARITFCPAQHWSSRTPFDRYQTLWGGFVVKTGSSSSSTKPSSPAAADSPNASGQPQTFFFTGDTGYCEVFKEIGARLGPMDVSAIAIGAYEPRWFMKPQHVNSEEGLQIHRDVGSRRSLAIHCCTWALTDEALDEPPRCLAEELERTGGDPSEFVTLQHGQMLVVRDGMTINTPLVLGPKRKDILLSKIDPSPQVNGASG